ncbi:hypothetical protein FRC19_000159 [Serendipita sp. 401]|nr:hypothetical protein FRC19_000159 [Serendipita sp. 401]
MIMITIMIQDHQRNFHRFGLDQVRASPSHLPWWRRSFPLPFQFSSLLFVRLGSVCMRARGREEPDGVLTRVRTVPSQPTRFVSLPLSLQPLHSVHFVTYA